MDALALVVDLFGRGAKSLEYRFRQRKGHFSFAREHALGTDSTQRRDLAKIGCARQHVHRRIQRTGVPDRFLRIAHPGRCEDQVPRGWNAGRFERVTMRSVAINRTRTLLPQMPHGVQIQVDYSGLDFVFNEEPGDGPSARSVSDNDSTMTATDSAILNG